MDHSQATAGDLAVRWTHRERTVFETFHLVVVGFSVLTLHCALAAEGRAVASIGPVDNGIIINPQSSYGFLGNGFLGRALGLDESTGLRLGGFLIPEFDWVASGGVKPGASFGSGALGLNVSVDTEKILEIPGGTLGIELLAASASIIPSPTSAAKCVVRPSWPDGIRARSPDYAGTASSWTER